MKGLAARIRQEAQKYPHIAQSGLRHYPVTVGITGSNPVMGAAKIRRKKTQMISGRSVIIKSGKSPKISVLKLFHLTLIGKRPDC